MVRLEKLVDTTVRVVPLMAALPYRVGVEDEPVDAGLQYSPAWPSRSKRRKIYGKPSSPVVVTVNFPSSAGHADCACLQAPARHLTRI